MGPFKLMSQTGVIDINYREPTTGSLLQGPGADHGEPITGYREPITGSRLQGADYREPITRYREPITGSFRTELGADCV